jgi:hypoxanthine phosphoribosyltransferase
MMNLNIIYEVVSGVVSVVGTIGTIYYGRMTRKLNRERISFTWSELQAGARDLARMVKESSFPPEIILTPSVRGTTVAGIIVLEFDSGLPLYTCIQEDVHRPFSFQPDGYTKVETSKWRIHVPEALRSHSDKKILIVDDFAMSGDALIEIRECLTERFGFREDAVRAATLVCTSAAKAGNKAPDFFWYKSPSPDFYFPWGRAR